MATEDFVHLHVHTEYSLLDGAAKLDPLFKRAVSLGQKSLGITDHGYLFGAYDFYRTAKKHGVKPIIGLEAYLTPGTSRKDRTRVLWGDQSQRQDDVSARGSYTHLTMWAENNEGLHNLFKIGSLASIEGQWGKWPRMDRELLSTYAKGMIGATGCPSGEVQTRLRLGQYDEALRAAADFRDIFGKDNYYVELMDHGLEIERRVVPDLLRLAKDLNLPLLATNDSHYVAPEDATVQEALLCLQTGNILSDPDRFKFDSDQFYLRSAQEMRAWTREFPEACDNTLLIAERCDVSFTTTSEGANYLPAFPVPAGEDATSWFLKEVERGLAVRYPGGISDAVRLRADYEVGVIISMGYPSYFLVVSDFIRWARDNGIRVGPGRGSGAGSMVAYALAITDLDPLEHGLLFERFLNPDRISMPDFDVDFDDRRREEVMEYVVNKYGTERVAQVVTFGKLKSKASIKDAARVLGHPYSVGDTLTKAIPPAVQGKDIPLESIMDSSHERYKEAEDFRRLCQQSEVNREVFELARGIEGITRQWGVHACAVIMSSEPLIDVIPLMKHPKDEYVLTQFEFPLCEELGLLKMDFLGVRNLTIISDALKNIALNGKEVPDLDAAKFDDDATFTLLQRGDTLGVFQLDGTGLRNLLRVMKPDSFEDISATIALYRPGPMAAGSHTNYALRKNLDQDIDAIHPELSEPLADILESTYGLIVYQEQVMAIAQRVAGFSLGQADTLRSAMGKKKKAVIERLYVPFREGMHANGFSQDAIDTLWNVLLPFAEYAFNKSHSAAYAVIAYQTAFLKARYPVEYMAALLTSTQDNKDKLSHYLAECRQMGIKVCPPDVNASRSDCVPVGGEIRFGLGGVRNVGSGVVEAIIATREEKGSFESFLDFLEKVPAAVCKKRTIESLIKAGAFDEMGYSRRSLVTVHEEAVDEAIGIKRNEAIGQFDLFSMDETPSLTTEIPELEEWDKKTKLGLEREMLGLYVSSHPLSDIAHLVRRHAEVEIGPLKDEDLADFVPRSVQISGIITGLQRKVTKAGKTWALVTLEDLTGAVEIPFFPSTYDHVSPLLAEDAVVAVQARCSVRDAELKLVGLDMKALHIDLHNGGAITISIAEHRLTEAVVAGIEAILRRHCGNTQVRLLVDGRDGQKVVTLPDNLRVDLGASFFGDLKALLGPGCLQA